MRYFATYAMRGRLQALLAICGLAVVPFVLGGLVFAESQTINLAMLFSLLLLSLGGLVSTALLALVALRMGAWESLRILLYSLLILALAGALMTGNPWRAGLYGLALWLPIWPVAWVLRETRNLAWALEGIAALAGLAVIAVYLPGDGPLKQWREMGRFSVNAPNAGDGATLTAGMSPDGPGFLMVGLLASWFMVGLVLPLLLARWQQAVLFNPGGFRQEFIALRLPDWVGYLGLGWLVLGYWGDGAYSGIGWNLLMVTCVLYLIAGFSIVHAQMGREGRRLPLFYVALLFIPQFVLPPLILLGFSDIWLDWRKLKRTPSG